MSHLEIAVLEMGGIQVISFEGEFDIVSEPQARLALKRVEEGRPDVILVDLSRLRFIDSTGLRVLVEANHRAAGEGRAMALLPGSTRVHMVFCITGLDKRLNFVDLCELLEPGAGSR